MARDTDRTRHRVPEPVHRHVDESKNRNPEDVGISTRHAVEQPGEPDEPEKVVPGRGTYPIGTTAANDEEPTDLIDFAPREATPPGDDAYGGPP